jgi:hypothetical protein
VTATAQGLVDTAGVEPVTPRARDHAKIETQKITTSRRIDLWKECSPEKASLTKKLFLNALF